MDSILSAAEGGGGGGGAQGVRMFLAVISGEQIAENTLRPVRGSVATTLELLMDPLLGHLLDSLQLLYRRRRRSVPGKLQGTRASIPDRNARFFDICPLSVTCSVHYSEWLGHLLFCRCGVSYMRTRIRGGRSIDPTDKTIRSSYPSG